MIGWLFWTVTAILVNLWLRSMVRPAPDGEPANWQAALTTYHSLVGAAVVFVPFSVLSGSLHGGLWGFPFMLVLCGAHLAREDNKRGVEMETIKQ